MSDLLPALAIWLGTYLLHSTVLFGVAWGIDRLRLVTSPGVRVQMWRAALIGALLTATAQSAGLADRAPMASLLAFSPPAARLAPAAPIAPLLAPALAVERPLADPTRLLAGGSTSDAAAAPAIPRAARGPRAAVLLWLSGALLFGARLVVLGWRTRRDLAGRAPAEVALRRELANLCAAPGLRVPTLTVTPALAGPIALPNGEIVLPPWVMGELGTRQQRAVLAHELAHQVRRDPQWLALGLALDALLWLQPMHRLARHRIAALAELEADAWAARLLRDPRALAESLASCAERLVTHRVALWSAGMVTGSRNDCRLLERIDLLLKGTSMSQPNSSWPARAGALAVLAAGIFLLPGCGPAGFAGIGGGSSTAIHISDDGDIRVSVHRSDYSLLMTCDGEATFAADESDLQTLAPGSTFELTEKLGGVERSYRVKAAADGQLVRTFKRDGDEMPMDNEARQWLGGAAPRMFRESGWNAEARVARLLARGGPELVLAEVDLAAGDHAKSTYLGMLLGSVQLDAAQWERALASAAKLGSDHELRTALELALKTQELDNARVAQLLTTALLLESDFELRSLLERMASRGSDPAVATAYLAAVRQLGSDFECRSALVALLDESKLDNAGLEGALEITSGLDSDFEKGSVLELLAKSVAADPELHRRYREVARSMSDHERGQALRALDDATAL